MSIEHRVKQGECIISIADKHGFFPDTIWNDSANAELRGRRQDPSILFPGDVIVVPEKRLKEEAGSTEERHRFRRKGVTVKIVIQFLEEGEPVTNEPYEVYPDVGMTASGQTDDDGFVEFLVSPKARSALVRIGEGEDIRHYDLRIGELDPVEETSGIQKRLNNLGYPSGTPDGMLDEETQSAVKQFQGKYGSIEQNGEIDEPTRNKLKEIYGS